MAALSSLDLTSALTEKEQQPSAFAQQRNAVVTDRDQQVEPLKLEPGQWVVGWSVAVGTVYRLADGRTVIVRKR